MKAIQRIANIAEYAVAFGVSYNRAFSMAISPANYRIMKRQLGVAS